MVMAMTFASFPHAVMILLAALALSDARLYEAADSLGTSEFRKFMTITLPGAKYGLISASMVVFTMAVSEFGVPKVIGGNTNVLAVDIYKQVIGQQNFSMGAVVGLVLLLPAVVAFAIDHIVQRKQQALLTARSVPYQPRPTRARDLSLLLLVIVMSSLMLVVVILGAVQMFVLALMGEYIGRLYNEVKGRPLYIVQEVAGREPRAGTLGYVAEATANSESPGGSGTRPITRRSSAKTRSNA
jgi:iron(III) transport system permease protein